GAGQHHGVIAENVRERDRGAAEESAAPVVALVTDGGPHHVIGGEPHAVRLVRELARVGKRERRGVEQRAHGEGGDRRRFRGLWRRRGTEAFRGAIQRRTSRRRGGGSAGR